MTASPDAVLDAVEQLARLRLHEDSSSNNGGTGSTSKQSVKWQVIAPLAETCANAMRSEQARTDLGNGSLLSTCAECLKASAEEAISPVVLTAQTQLCRIVGNATLDHPQNRQRCFELEIPQRILHVLSTLHAGGQASYEMEWLQAVKACTGALLNLSIETPQIASLLYDQQALQILGKNLSLYQIGAWSAYSSDSVTLIRALTAEWSVNLIKEILEQEGSDITSVAIPLVLTITSLPIPQQSEAKSAQTGIVDSDQAYTLVSADLSILSSASELLESRIYTNDSIQEDIAFPTDNSKLLQNMAEIVESGEILPSWKPVIEEDTADGDDSLEAEKTFSHFKADVARIIIGVCSNDRVMKEAFKQGSSVHWLLSTCISWLQSPRSDLIITGSTILANLARSDEYCTILVQEYDLASILANILKSYVQHEDVMRRQPGEAVQVLHGVVGLLKNLAIPGANKQTLCDAGVINPCLSLLISSYDIVVPLQNAAIGVLKHLCAGNISSSLKVILPPTAPGASAIVSLQPSGTSQNGDSLSSPLSTILSLISRTNDVRLQCEATRLLVNIVRSLYSSRSVTSPVTPAALGGLEMGIAKMKARNVIENSEGVVDAISEIVRTGEKYPMLVNEGIVALTLLSTTESGARFALKALTNVTAVPPQLDEQGEVSAVSLSAPGDDSRTNGSHHERSVSRTVSLNPKNAPSRAVDVLVRWINNYAIAAQDMPAELAGNALSLLECVSRLPGSAEVLPVSEITKCLEGVLRRAVTGPAEQVLKDAAQRNLDFLKVM